MAQSLEEFAAQCGAALRAAPGEAGRRQVTALVRAALADPGFVAAQVPEGTPERHVLYEDSELGFTILAHAYTGPRTSGESDPRPRPISIGSMAQVATSASGATTSTIVGQRF